MPAETAHIGRKTRKAMAARQTAVAEKLKRTRAATAHRLVEKQRKAAAARQRDAIATEQRKAKKTGLVITDVDQLIGGLYRIDIYPACRTVIISSVSEKIHTVSSHLTAYFIDLAQRLGILSLLKSCSLRN